MTNNIKALLEKYWQGESSLEEEQLIKQYFNGDVAEDLKMYTPMFKHWNDQSQIKSQWNIPTDLEALNIDLLLKKYWDCQSSLEEEKELKSYFQSGKVHTQFEEYTSYFNLLNSQSQIETGALRIGTVDLNKHELKSKSPSKIRSISRKWVSLAASLFIGGLIWFNSDLILQSGNDSGDFASTMTQEEQEAYDVTMEALAFLSGKLEKGSSVVQNDFKKVANARIFNVSN